MPPLLLTNAAVVTPDRLLDGATVAVEDGRITAVEERAYATGPEAIDLGGRTLLPGLVDLHNDAIEGEINPRPGADFPPGFALLQLDRKLAAVGVTTEFHGVYFAERETPGRSLDLAPLLADAVREVREGGEATIDHHVLFRLDVRTHGAFDAVAGAVARARVPLVSLNDHVPGQGQFGNVDAYRRYMARNYKGVDPARLDALVEERLGEAATTEHVVAETLRRVTTEGARRGLILGSHDDDTAARVDQMCGLGCRIAEFPLTVAAAERARFHGMTIAMGAANAFRGGSLSGNVDTLELLWRGLVDVLVADYYAPALLAALFKIVGLGLLDLPAATRLITANPAAAVGLDDRGAIAVGRRADLVVVEHRGGVPLPLATMVGGAWRYAVAAFPAPVAAGAIA